MSVWDSDGGAFRSEVRAFLAAELSEDLREAARRTTGLFTEFEYGHRWFKKLSARGWAAPNWPTSLGGTGWSEEQRFIFDMEATLADAPKLFTMGTRWIGPVLHRFGTDVQRQRYLPGILSGDNVWCQGYSEPGAGSDLANLQLRADRTETGYVLNGSKIWTTWAHHATHIFCLVRTSHEGKPQRGISFLLLPLDQPGIEISPIITISGDHEVNQVFFSDVHVPFEDRVGAENEGWTVAKFLLEYERGGDAYSPSLRARMKQILAMAAAEKDATGQPLLSDRAVRHRMAELDVRISALEAMEQQAYATMAAGGSPGPVSSALKIVGSELIQGTSALALDILGPRAIPFQIAALQMGSDLPYIGPGHAATAMPLFLNNLAQTIFSGSNEIQRNIIAKTLLAQGFSIIATSGTRDYLAAQGLEVGLVRKVLEGRPHIVDAMKNGEVQLVFNTTDGKQALADSFSIRRTALMMKIPYYTTASGSLAAAQAIAAVRHGEMDVRPIQSYN